MIWLLAFVAYQVLKPSGTPPPQDAPALITKATTIAVPELAPHITSMIR